MFKLERKVKLINNMISSISNKVFPLSYIVIFGSVLTDKFDENSDLDICFIHEDESTLSSTQQNDIERFFRQSVGEEMELDYTYATLSTFLLGKDVFEDIRNKGLILWKHIGQ